MNKVRTSLVKRSLLYSLICIFALVMLSGWVSALTTNECNLIHSYDSMIPTQIEYQNLSDDYKNFTGNQFGSLNRLYWNGSSTFVTDRYNELVYASYYRYNNNFSQCYPSGDPYYMNSSIRNLWYEGSNYLARLQDSTGSWKDGTGTSASTQLVGAMFSKMFREINDTQPSLLEERINISVYEDIGDNALETGTNNIINIQADRWQGLETDGTRDFRRTNNTISYFSMSYNGTKYIVDSDRNADLYLDYNITLEIGYNCTGGSSIRSRYTHLGTDGVSQALTCDGNWNVYQFEIPKENESRSSTGNPVQYQFKFTSTIGNLSIDYINLTFKDVKIRDHWYQALIEAVNKYELNRGNQWGVTGKYFVGNQEFARAVNCYYVYNLTGDTTALNCYKDSVQSIISNSTDGVFVEPADAIFATYPNHDTNITAQLKNGYSSKYQMISMSNLADLYRETNNQTYYQYLNNSMDFIAYMMIPTNGTIDIQSGLSTRQPIRGLFTDDDIGGDNPLFPLMSSFMTVKDNKYSNRISWHINKSLQQTIYVNNSYAFNGMMYGYTTGGMIDMLRSWNVSGDMTILPNENGSNYLKNFNRTGILVEKTNNLTAYISYGWATPSGGIIADIYDTEREIHLFSGAGGSKTSNAHYGLGMLKGCTGNCNETNTYNNAWNGGASLAIISSSYPYKVRINGTLVYVNQNDTGITYETNYTFYNNYIKVVQTTNSIVELQLWSVSTETLGSSYVPSGDMQIKNNITFFPLFDLNYTDTTNNATWGTVDKFNATGTQFVYYIGLNGYDFIGNELLYLDNPYAVNKKLQLKNMSSPLFYNGTLSSGTTLTNSQSNLSLDAGDHIYVA